MRCRSQHQSRDDIVVICQITMLHFECRRMCGGERKVRNDSFTDGRDGQSSPQHQTKRVRKCDKIIMMNGKMCKRKHEIGSRFMSLAQRKWTENRKEARTHQIWVNNFRLARNEQ